ncbi:uncharacterized protein LOC128274538 [Anopheles cruzii]|uniref:uncharacterized protein LOC128274538 n=1 Tax=Anopheles cruzii TaxID=68878 RepID=UPI0022EC6426|nr:uncharacterized protein LOC128274538 [Anopheles cruzii]
MKVSLYIILISILLSKHYALSHIIRKRQLFREQVLPHAGGKIPDSAFLTDRLALNRLQTDGIAVPDGVLLEQRQHQVYPHQQRTARPTFRVVQTPDSRYTSPEGEYSHNALATVDTTYLIPHAGDKLLLHDYPYPHHRAPYGRPTPTYASSIPKVPIVKELRIPNYAVFNFDYNTHKKKKSPPVGLPVALKHSPLPPHPIDDGPWSSSRQRLAQDYVSYHHAAAVAAVGNGLNYQHPSVVASFDGSGSGWTSGGGWTPSDGSAISGSLWKVRQPFGGSFEDYYNQFDAKHRFYRHTGEPKQVAKPVKPNAISRRPRQRGAPVH